MPWGSALTQTTPRLWHTQGRSGKLRPRTEWNGALTRHKVAREDQLKSVNAGSRLMLSLWSARWRSHDTFLWICIQIYRFILDYWRYHRLLKRYNLHLEVDESGRILYQKWLWSVEPTHAREPRKSHGHGFNRPLSSVRCNVRIKMGRR